MKKYIIIFSLFFSLISFSQELRQPAEGKVMVYFTRTSSLGFLINFKFFDGEKYLGKFNYGKYLAYECEPGKHLFWVKAENFDFVEAELEANKIYIIDAEPQMGAFKSAVKLVPFDNNPASYKDDKKYQKKKKLLVDSIIKIKEYTLSEEDFNEEKKYDLDDVIKKGIDKYNKKVEEGFVFAKMTSEMNYQ